MAERVKIRRLWLVLLILTLISCPGILVYKLYFRNSKPLSRIQVFGVGISLTPDYRFVLMSSLIAFARFMYYMAGT
jgi:hypothetical protein